MLSEHLEAPDYGVPTAFDSFRTAPFREAAMLICIEVDEHHELDLFNRK